MRVLPLLQGEVRRGSGPKRWIAALLAPLLLAAPALAEQRLALLIGNEDYPASVSRLNNPHEDVDVLAAALRQAGFARGDIRVLKDAGKDETIAAVNAFQRDLSAAGSDAVGFFYYSGHGGSVERRGFRENFLIPARADVTTAADLPLNGVSLSDVIDTLAATSAKAVFVISDACRNTLPFARGADDPDKGFSPEPARPGLFIVHATAEGSTAPDDGMFARALAANLPRAGEYAERAFTLAFRDVAATRATYRLPTISSDLRQDFCFVSCPGESAPPASAAPPAPAVPSAEQLTREAQQLLAAMGYDPGPADGSAGTRTGDAVAAFRAATGLGSGRVIDASLVAALRLFSGQGHRAAQAVDVLPPADTVPPAATTSEPVLATSSLRDAYPIWDRQPTGEDYDRFYPSRARRWDLAGRASVECRIGLDGRLDCAIATESPSGWGFGAAAVSLASVLVAAPRMSDGGPSANEIVELEFVFTPKPGSSE